MTRGIEATAFIASMKYQAWIIVEFEKIDLEIRLCDLTVEESRVTWHVMKKNPWKLLFD